MSAHERVHGDRGDRLPAAASRRAPRAAALIATVLVAIALLAAAAPASAAAISAQISGTWHTTAESKWGAGTTDTYDVEVKWTESFDGAYWSLSSLSGTVKLIGPAPSGETPCEGTLKEAAGAAGAFLAGQRAGSGGRLAPKIAYVPESGKWQITPVEPISGELLESDGNADTACAIGTQPSGFVEQEGKYSSWTASGTTGNYFLEGDGGPACKQVSASSNLVEFPPETSLTQADECVAKGNFTDAPAQVSWTAELDQQVTFSTPVVIRSEVAPVEKKTAATKATKNQALEERLHLQAHMDLNEAVLRAKIACGLEPNRSIYGALDLTALPGELGEPSLQALNPLVSAGVSAILGSTAAPNTVASCKAAALDVRRALERYLADPPDLSYDRLAPAPAHAEPRAHGARAGACALASGRAAANCRSVLQAAAGLASARAKVEGVEEALTTVSNRLATASAAGDQSAITLQSAASDALMGELAAAHEVQNSAQRAFAGALAKYKIKITLKSSAAARGVAQLTAKAAALGVAASQLKAAAGGELVKRKLTFASLLNARASTALALALWRSQTLEGLLAVYSAMKSSGQIPSKQRAALDVDISGAFAASAGTARLTKMKAFVATAATIKTNAGALLHYAAEPLA
jgi:hypothetical protein